MLQEPFELEPRLSAPAPGSETDTRFLFRDTLLPRLQEAAAGYAQRYRGVTFTTRYTSDPQTTRVVLRAVVREGAPDRPNAVELIMTARAATVTAKTFVELQVSWTQCGAIDAERVIGLPAFREQVLPPGAPLVTEYLQEFEASMHRGHPFNRGC